MTNIELPAILQCAACQSRGKTWRGDGPTCAFPNGSVWSANNWNCATDGMLRALEESKSHRVWHVRDDDQNIMAVSLIGLGGCDDAVSLVMTWYKHRGRTEQAWLVFSDSDPRRPTEEEAVNIDAAIRTSEAG